MNKLIISLLTATFATVSFCALAEDMPTPTPSNQTTSPSTNTNDTANDNYSRPDDTQYSTDNQNNKRTHHKSHKKHPGRNTTSTENKDINTSPNSQPEK